MSASAAIVSLQRMSGKLRTMIRKTLFGSQMLEGLARIGHATRGVVYLFLGLLATTAALGSTRPPNLAGAFSIIDHLPGGWVLLLAVALGLCAYAGWRLTQALLDLPGYGWHVQGLLRRVGMLFEALLYTGIGTLASIISLSGNREIREEIGEEATFAVVWTGRILNWPLGHWIIGAVGLGTIAIGCGQLLKARQTAFEDIDASERAMIGIRIVGRIGFAAKGVIIGATGILFLIAAWRVEASGVGGMRAALLALAAVPVGDRVLLAVSAGLALYGVFSLIKAGFHKRVTP